MSSAISAVGVMDMSPFIAVFNCTRDSAMMFEDSL